MAAYVWLSARVPRRWIAAASLLCVCASLLAFRAAYGHASEQALARALFVWISVVNLFLVAGFWSVISDSFDFVDGARRVGPIAAGGTAGAIAGPACAAALAPHVTAADLLVPATVLLAVAALLLHAIARRDDAAATRGLDAPPWRSLGRLAADPRLRGLAVMVVLHAVLSTFVYLLQARLVAAGLDESAARVRLFAASDLAVNLATAALQLGATGWLLRRAGVVACVVALPAVAVAGLSVLAVWPVLAVAVVVNVALRIAQFAFTRPVREMLFSLLPPTDRYRARTALDTLLYRASDAAGAWLVSALGTLGLATAGVAAAGVPLAGVWWWVSDRTVRRVRGNDAGPPLSESGP
jgi:ATP:ADP antiporter, AAA family